MHKPFFLLFALLCLAAPALAKDPVHLYMPDAPPLTLLNQGSHHGLTGDIVLAALARSGRLVRIEGEPWPRAQMRVASGRNLLIVPLSRTPEREEQYTWIAPLMILERAFFSLDEPVSSFAEALQRYQRIGVGLGTPQAEILKQQGFSESQIVQLKLGENPAWMLEKGRIDA
ncbi:ABC transporter substrate-binding protein [Pseudomonas sp. NCCP-436]|uniref:substrate-binding periplasmic protein n=1 Tax=Pseudomonas sp. NCCP-436 TaxID=2842481 RepID=UPI001DBA684B|nr:transporter substrate-binding domain-containing protein [Pseudomonas sp. NCCP-436]GIZ11800.1 hypothetical protein NCCP436_12160 [Pseudomonas sp. NCCP-436]